MGSQAFPAWVFVVPLVMIGIGYLLAFTRKGSVGSTRLGSRRIDLHVPGAPVDVFQRIANLGGKYHVDDQDPEARIVILSSSVSLFTWGFFYPVYVHADGTGSRIEIGIASKFVQAGPIVGNAHRQCARAIEDALGVPTARVA